MNGLYPRELGFNPNPSTVMHIDLNSCFATIEQQANPLLRGKPIAVAAYPTDSGCILAPSVEAKRYGIKTGMRVREGKKIFPDLIVLSPDPWKYRMVHLQLRKLLSVYTDKVVPKSIDEFVLHLDGYPAAKRGFFKVGGEIKQRIKSEIGEWLTVSVGIAPNRFLAKTAAGLHKPDGLDEINKDNFLSVYSRLKLDDLCGIATHNSIRLNNVGIYNVLDFYNSPLWKLKAAFKSVGGYYWYLRLRGWEIDDVEFKRRSYGNSYSLPKPFFRVEDLSPILSQLTEKMSFRLRKAGYKAKGVSLALTYRDGSFWHESHLVDKFIFDPRDFYRISLNLLLKTKLEKQVREIYVSCFCLSKTQELQLQMFEDVEKKERLVGSIDEINKKWGDSTIFPGRMLQSKSQVLDKIAFGGVKELEEFTRTVTG